MRRAQPGSRLAVGWKRKLRHRFGASAPKLAVRTHVPWYLRVLPWALVLVVVPAVVVWVYGLGAHWFQGGGGGASAAEFAQMRDRVGALEQELAETRSNSRTAGNTLQIERTTRDQLLQQVKQLEAENAKLRQDLSLFESLAETENGAGDVTISGLRIEPDEVAGHFRYRMLIAVRGAHKEQREREFRGQLQLVVKMHQHGKAAMITLPAQNDPKRDQYRFNFKHFQRVDGSFEIPEGAKLGSVEVRLLEDGATKVAKTVNLG